jgi:hypothetical protein
MEECRGSVRGEAVSRGELVPPQGGSGSAQSTFSRLPFRAIFVYEGRLYLLKTPKEVAEKELNKIQHELSNSKFATVLPTGSEVELLS